MDNKELLLRILIDNIPVNKSRDFSFNQLSRDTRIEKDELDRLLKELDNERYITQFAMEHNDVFKVNMNDTALTYNFNSAPFYTIWFKTPETIAIWDGGNFITEMKEVERTVFTSEDLTRQYKNAVVTANRLQVEGSFSILSLDRVSKS